MRKEEKGEERQKAMPQKVQGCQVSSTPRSIQQKIMALVELLYENGN